MAIPRRAQAHKVPLAKPADGPLFLAELPHVGEKSTVVQQQRAPAIGTSKDTQPAISSHPAFAEIAAARGRVEQTTTRREQLERRFLDEAHLEAQALQDERQTAAQLSPYHAPAPSSWRSLFSLVHTQLAPFAGLIVTLALLTSAGLLYWLISRGEPTRFDLQEFQRSEGAYRVQMNDPDPVASAIPIAETTETLKKSPDTKAESQVSAPVEAVSKPIVAEKRVEEQSVEKPSVDKPIAEEQPATIPTDATVSIPLGQISFPSTATPEELDWSKAFEATASQPLGELFSLPEVAEREVPTSVSPVAR